MLHEKEICTWYTKLQWISWCTHKNERDVCCHTVCILTNCKETGISVSVLGQWCEGTNVIKHMNQSDGCFRCDFCSLNELTEVRVNGKPPSFLSRESVPGDLDVSKVSALMWLMVLLMVCCQFPSAAKLWRAARPEYQTARDLPQISPQPCETYMEGDRNLVYVSGYVCGTHKHNQSTDVLQISSSQCQAKIRV